MSAARTPHRFAPAFWLAALLLCAQMLGLAHRVLHAPGLGGEPALFAGHHAGDADCRLVDHASGEPALPPALPVLPPPPTSAAPAAEPAAARPAGCTSAYLARAPPRG